MSHNTCPFETPDCKYFNGPLGCYADKHHVFYPKADYETRLEKVFRNLPENVIELPRCIHDDGHASEEPPLKPSMEVMRHAVNESRITRVLAGERQ